MPAVEPAVCAEVQKRVGEHFDRQDRDIASIKEQTSELTEISVKISTMLEQLTNIVSDQGSRLKELESKPAKRYDYMIQVIIQYILIAVLAFIKIN